jgi:hypothetical protein
MRRPSRIGPDDSDRKTIRRIFFRVVGVYMSLILIVVGGAVAKSMITVRPGTSLSHNADNP